MNSGNLFYYLIIIIIFALIQIKFKHLLLPNSGTETQRGPIQDEKEMMYYLLQE